MCWPVRPDCRGTTFWLKEVAMFSARSKRIMLFLCGLSSRTKSKFMIRSYFTAAVPRLIFSDVNFNFFCFVHNHRFCFLHVLCATVFASSGHHVLLLKFGLQDTLSHNMLKKKNLKCNTVVMPHLCSICINAVWVSCHVTCCLTFHWVVDKGLV